MAYNNKNLLRKIAEIQDLTLEKTDRGAMSYKEVYWIYIKPRYHISYRTFSHYLGVPAKRLLKKK